MRYVTKSFHSNNHIRTTNPYSELQCPPARRSLFMPIKNLFTEVLGLIAKGINGNIKRMLGILSGIYKANAIRIIHIFKAWNRKPKSLLYPLQQKEEGAIEVK
jgi:hypothetical protein